MIRLMRARKGASLVEYGTLVGLISVIAIGSILKFGSQVQTEFNVTTANLDWYVDGVTDDQAARYRFTVAENPANSNYIGVDLDGISGETFGEISEADSDVFDLRTLQYDQMSGELQVYLAGDTEDLTDGYDMSCIDLTQGTTAFTFDFDTNPGYNIGAIGATVYQASISSVSFTEGQNLACVIDN